MLRVGFIGNENAFDRAICEWLGERTDLSVIIWTNGLSWAGSTRPGRAWRVARRFVRRLRRRGIVRTADEAFYFLLYRSFLQATETAKLAQLTKALHRQPRLPIQDVRQLRPLSIHDPSLERSLQEASLDALFAMCIDVHLPTRLIELPRFGSFLWHEGITPEYRGVHAPFWALSRQDYEHLGFTLLRMNSRLDGGESFLQGTVQGIDPKRDWHSYIGHKAILDSLPEVERFLADLESGRHKPLPPRASTDRFFSYPTGTALLKIAARRVRSRWGVR